VTGVYDNDTSAAVRVYQQQHHLGVDGKAGIKTMQHMLAYLNYGF
jgi:peptidoglycan hydrolase-like protein with peptidoglycan-binding domain